MRENTRLSELLIQKVRIFIEEAGYSPENISILIPSVKVKERIEQGLGKAGYESVWIKDEDFDFKQEGVIRLCPIHSSKGLDFPVVMLYLPFFYPPKTEDDEKKQRNLLYVAITRAMDNLNIFVNPEKNPVLQELVDCLDAAGAFIAGKIGSADVSGLEMSFYRFAIASICLFAYIIAKKLSFRIGFRNILIIAAIGSFGILGYHLLFFKAIALISVLESSSINTLAPILSAFFGYLLFKEPLNLKGSVFLLAASFGVTTIIID